MYKYAPAATQNTQNQIRARINIRIFGTFPPIIFGALRIFVWIPGKRNIFYMLSRNRPGTGETGTKQGSRGNGTATRETPAIQVDTVNITLKSVISQWVLKLEPY